ncbi:MAG: hypothetical protein ACI8Q1_002469 [Parvicella sp.]
MHFDLNPFDIIQHEGDGFAFSVWSPTEVNRGYEIAINIRGYEYGGMHFIAPVVDVNRWRSEEANYDIQFRTYVDVPEPSTLALLFPAFALIICRSRRSRSQLIYKKMIKNNV